MADLCGAHKKRGGTCGKSAGWGTDHPGIGPCKLHGGATRNHRKRAQKETARREVLRLGLAASADIGRIDPREVLTEELWRTRCAVIVLDAAVGQLKIEQGDVVKANGRLARATHAYGPTYHATGGPTGEAKQHVLVTMWQEERRHLASVATAAARAGVEERRVQIEQERGELIARLFRAVFEDPELGLDRGKLRKALTVAAKHLRKVAGAEG